MKVLVETSARHVHVTDADLAVLFGEGYQLTKKKDLSQPGQYASNERVDVIGPKGTMANVSILGPTRSSSQVELSLTDARKIGIVAPIRESGDIEGTPGCTLKGPAGEVTLECGVIAAKRHIHFTPEDAKQFNVEDHEVVSVKIETADRTTTFGDVVVRVSPKFAAAMHIDTDESNAAGCSGHVEGEVIVEKKKRGLFR
ncbi:MAG: phosphate propanoyltransferase [Acutalibacteraceae bacterium]|nr:phosphate propanoyltransferase [Bacillota bacterium]